MSGSPTGSDSHSPAGHAGDGRSRLPICVEGGWPGFFDCVSRGIADALAARRGDGDRPSNEPVVGSVTAVAMQSNDPFAVLVSTMISLRTKDEVTLPASQRLLALAPDPRSLAEADVSAVEPAIYPAGFYKTKAKHLIETARRLVQDHGGRVPSRFDDLVRLPGVGRKTANLVLGLGFGIPAICVDTHVHRLTNRLGWAQTKTPAETEAELAVLLPIDFWIPINELFVRFGQEVCTPVSPRCTSVCPLDGCCPRSGVGKHR